MAELTVSEARAELASVIDRVEGGEEFELTRHGRTVAVLVPPNRLRPRNPAAQTAIAEAEELRRRVTEGRPTVRGRRRQHLGAQQADELARSVRRDRDGR